MKINQAPRCGVHVFCLILAVLPFSYVYAGQAWARFNPGWVMSCYSPDVLCDRYDMDFDPIGVGLWPGCVDRDRNVGFQIYQEWDRCFSGQLVVNADADGCWSGDVLCGAPPEAKPGLGGLQCHLSKPLTGNPINPATGNKYQRETDFYPIGPAGLLFERFYNTNSDVTGTAGIGARWSHSYSASIRSVFDDNHNQNLIITRPNGQKHYYYVLNDGYASQTWSAELNETTTGWSLRLPSGDKETFNREGLLESIVRPGGHVARLTYDSVNRLVSVEDTFGRKLTFSYDTASRITDVSGPTGAVWSYGYDNEGRLSEVLLPDLTTWTKMDNPRRSYIYADTRFPTFLTGITDERGNQVGVWFYDDLGRAISSEHAGGTNSHTLTYNPDESTTVMDPQGRERTYTFTSPNGIKQVANVTGEPCLGCAINARSYTHGADGLIASNTDYKGNTTLFRRDSAGRVVERVEASGVPESRTELITWDGDHGRPLAIERSGQVTTYTYDTEGRVLTQSITPQPR